MTKGVEFAYYLIPSLNVFKKESLLILFVWIIFLLTMNYKILGRYKYSYTQNIFILRKESIAS